MSETVYIRNESGGIHSMTKEFLEETIKEDSIGRTGATAQGPKYLPRGWEEISEQEAREGHPQLFGKHDPQVVYTPDELKRAIEHKRLSDELNGVTLGD